MTLPHFKNEFALDNVNDPNDTRIIGSQYSEITSGRGSLPIKLSTTNPNFGALMIELFKDAGLKRGDHIAICATGSFPALNIAASATAQVLGLEVSFIASTTSSSWGANDPNYTYLDIHSSLQEGGLVNFAIIAGSIGANQDIGRTLSPYGRELCTQAILRNGAELIQEGSLEANISKRMALFASEEDKKAKPIKLFINIGGGVASLGSKANAEQIPSGLIKDEKLDDIPDKQGVLFQMAAKDIPYINLLHIQRIMSAYDLPRDPIPLPQVGQGELFFALKYDLRFVIGALLGLTLLLVSVIIFDKRQNAIGKEVVHQGI